MSGIAPPRFRCWCAPRSELVPFGEGYVACVTCGTLVFADPPDAGGGAIDDDAALYGAQYWTRHQIEAGLPPIEERARQDLPERCVHWLRALLRYRRPPARVLEIGASHGGFLRLAALAGYEAVGIEMSPTIVDLARRTFDVDVRLGPLESAGLADASFDVVVSFDVLEHLAQPEESLRGIRRVLRPDGVLLCQTPDFREIGADELRAANDPFLKHLGGPDHLFLFSKRSVRAILERTGFPHAVFEPPVYSYDMFFAAGTERPAARSSDEVGTLLASSDGRIALALIDLYEREEELRTIAAERLAVIDGLRQACDERLALIERLDRQLRER